MDILKQLATELSLKETQVEKTVELLDGGDAIPFIARYRKEVTGSLDDQILRTLADRLNYLRNLEKKMDEVKASIEAQEKLTPELETAIYNATTLVELEDLYRPFRPKRKTRASVARAKGLEPLAKMILEQKADINPQKEAEAFLTEEVATIQDAIQGAMDILAEDFSDDADLRKDLRFALRKNGNIISKAIDAETDTVYKDYYEFSEPFAKIQGHRVLALDRGEREKVLKISLDAPQELLQDILYQRYVKGNNDCSLLVKTACTDSLSRLIFPSIERELRNELTEDACEKAIDVFAKNLRPLLLQPPVKNTITLGLDPGFTHGCKMAVIDATGKVLHTQVLYITARGKDTIEREKAKLKQLIVNHKVTTIAIGNGTASRESEMIVADILKELGNPNIHYMVVSEAGASIYSATKLAAEEFPDFDVNLRSAVSIARRLQDPLAELVKIPPCSIGVGQYQHDMPQTRLNEALSGVVEDCVNSVGVDLNTASHSLLSYIAGISAAVAKNIVAYREENGAFTNRKELLKVAKLGPKAYQQCAGFLRVRDGKEPLDNTGVHPESYDAARELLKECDLTIENAATISEKVQEKGISAICEKLNIGKPTLLDIIKELQKPGRDFRDELPPPLMRSGDVMSLEDLKEGMELVGTVRNVVDFGAFVDIGVHEDGLVHISHLCDRFVKHPLDVVKVGDVVKVKVLGVDVKRGRISLTMKGIKQ